MINRKYAFLIISVAVSILLSLFFYISFDHPIAGDASQYKTITENLLHHKAYSLSDGPPYSPTTLREPAYPVFLASLLWVFKGNYTAIYIAQIIIFVLTVILVYYLSLKIFGEKTAGWAALITALCPTLANYPSYLLSETFFTFLLVLFMVIILKAVETNKAGWYVCAGFLLGISTLTKSITALLFIPIVFSGVLYAKNLSAFLKKYLKNFIVFSLIFLVTAAPWAIRNYAKFGKFSLSLRFGMVLWVRGEKLAYDFEDTKKAIVFSLSEYLGKKFYPEVEKPNHFLLKEGMANYRFIEKLASEGYNEAEIDHIQVKEAWGKISQEPLKYLSQNFLEAVKMGAFLYIPLLNEPHIIEKFNQLNYGQFLLSGFRSIFRLLAIAVLGLVLLGFFAGRKRWREWIFIATLIIYVNLVYSFLFGWGRYAVPLIPFYFMFAVTGIDFIKNKFTMKGVIKDV